MGSLTNHELNIDVCLSKILDKKERRYRDATIQQIMIFVTALLNSFGGVLYLNFDASLEGLHLKDLIRSIEQRVQELTTCFTVSELFLEKSANELIITLKGATNIVTLNYNLYLPSDSQVMALPPSEPVENIKKILQKMPTKPESPDSRVVARLGTPTKPEKPESQVMAVSGTPAKPKEPGSRIMVLPRTSTKYVPEKLDHPDFEQGRPLESMNESKRVVYKFLKENPSKRVTIADRIIGNKLSSYVSAFANHSGGVIYYGIKEDGTVIGERITKRDQENITRKVAKAMMSVIWPNNCGQRGTHWDISFYSVLDANRNKIPFTNVICISIFQCPGGVFTEEPESYHIENGRAVKVPFRVWKSRITGVLVYIPPHVPRIQWSSPTKRKIYSEVTTKLIQYRNESMMRHFEKFSELVVSKYPKSDASLVVISEKVAFALKQHSFHTAEFLCGQFEESLVKSADPLIFQVRNLYLKSRIERAKEKYKESYETAKEGIRMMEQIPAEFMTVWFYIHTATVAMALSSLDLPEKSHSFREAKKFLEFASRDANALEDEPKKVWDLQQKLSIYKASVLLGCSLTGGTIDESLVSDSDIREAKSALISVHRSILDTKSPTQFRKIQYFLAQSDLYYRYGQRSKDYFQNWKLAFELASQAQSLARKCLFQEMVVYANRRLARLTENLIRLRVRNSSVEEDFNNCVENIELE